MEKVMKRPNLINKRLIIDYNSVIIAIVLIVGSLLFVSGMDKSFYRVILESSFYGMIALGLSLVMVTGNIDLSIGFAAGVATIVTVAIFNLVYDGSNGFLALIISLIAALLCGALTGGINGFVVTKIGVSPLIATIATNYIYKGIVFKYAQEAFTADGEIIKTIAGTKIFGLKWLTPAVLIFAVVVIALIFVMYKTKFGNDVYVVGDNPEAAEYAGISVAKTTWKTYILCGMLGAVTAFFLVSRAGNAMYTQCSSLDTFSISACVLGGIKMAGGKGTIVNTVLGIIVMRTIQTIMSTLFLATAWVNFVSGALLIVVLIVDRITATKEN